MKFFCKDYQLDMKLQGRARVRTTAIVSWTKSRRKQHLIHRNTLSWTMATGRSPSTSATKNEQDVSPLTGCTKKQKLRCS